MGSSVWFRSRIGRCAGACGLAMVIGMTAIVPRPARAAAEADGLGQASLLAPESCLSRIGSGPGLGPESDLSFVLTPRWDPERPGRLRSRSDGCAPCQ